MARLMLKNSCLERPILHGVLPVDQSVLEHAQDDHLLALQDHYLPLHPREALY